ncbi:MAG: hypothetical protein DRQ39_07140, partial [Gammaproteobacteria bacterium]
MALIPRHPGNQDTMHRHDENSGTMEPGAIVRLTSDGKLAPCTASGHVPYAISFQRVGTDAPGVPANFKFPNQEGSSDASLGDAILVYKDGGTYHTELYNITSTTGIAAGTLLYCQTDDPAENAKLVDDDGSTVDVAQDEAG